MTYKVWITITVRHTFFHTENAGVELKETDATSRFLQKSGLLFRKQNAAQWVLLKPETEPGTLNLCNLILKEAETFLDFELLIKSPDFYYMTRWEDTGLQSTSAGIRFRAGEEGGKIPKYLQVRIDPQFPERPGEIPITLPCREVRWEYILIPKYGNNTYPVELKESQDRLIFSVPEPISFPGEKEVYRSISSSFIPMKETYPYKIGLWERRENGRRLLNNHMPFPKVTSASVVEPGEVISSYFYY